MTEENIEEQAVARFDVKTESKLLSALNKIFGGCGGNCSEQDVLDMDMCSVVDMPNVCMCVAKSQEMKRTLYRFVDKNREIKIPSAWNFVITDKHVDKNLSAKYSSDYMVNILNIFKHVEDVFSISFIPDGVGKFENEHMIIYLAPRIDSE